MHRGAGEGVVVVVPGLAERGKGEPEDVRGPVVHLEAARSQEVADRVDAPGHVVDEEDADQAAPEQSGRRPEQGAGEQIAGHRGNGEAEHDQRHEPPVDQPHARVLVEVGGVALPLGAAVLGEQPAHVGVPEAAQDPDHAVAVSDVGAVRVALDVGVRVVLAVVGDPGDHRALHGHRAEGREGVLGRLVGPEGAVGEHAVEADRDPARRGEVHDRQQRQVVPAHQAAPEQDDRRDGGGEGHHHGAEVDDLADTRHEDQRRQGASQRVSLKPNSSTVFLSIT